LINSKDQLVIPISARHSGTVHLAVNTVQEQCGLLQDQYIKLKSRAEALDQEKISGTDRCLS
jgi:hypothetical protein